MRPQEGRAAALGTPSAAVPPGDKNFTESGKPFENLITLSIAKVFLDMSKMTSRTDGWPCHLLQGGV